MPTRSVHTEVMNIEIGNEEGRPMKEKLSSLGMLRIMQNTRLPLMFLWVATLFRMREKVGIVRTVLFFIKGTYYHSFKI